MNYGKLFESCKVYHPQIIRYCTMARASSQIHINLVFWRISILMVTDLEFTEVLLAIQNIG